MSDDGPGRVEKGQESAGSRSDSGSGSGSDAGSKPRARAKAGSPADTDRQLRWSVRKSVGRIKRAVAAVRAVLLTCAGFALCAGAFIDVPGQPYVSFVLAIVFVIGAIVCRRNPLAWALVAAIAWTPIALLFGIGLLLAGSFGVMPILAILIGIGAWMAVADTMLLRRLLREQPELAEKFWKQKPRSRRPRKPRDGSKRVSKRGD